MATIITTTFAVAGMTCGHCVASVTTEVGRLDCVTAVEVELVPGGMSMVRVSGLVPAGPAAVSAAVEEAGYFVTGVVS